MSQRIQPSLNFKYPTNRDSRFKSPSLWLKSKKIDDDTDGLWRIHDNLYDVSDFISSHPGGPMWLELTKGTDATEAFEAHHISSLAEEFLKKYFVRKADKPRNSPFTFKDDGFYRTLKRNVAVALKTVPKDSANVSDYITDILCLGTFICAILSSQLSSVFFAVVSSFCLSLTTIAAHNYFHRKDNFRMYYFNLCLMDFREWRISHSLSHHLFPNTIYDFEISGFEPFIQYLPNKKSLLVKWSSSLLILILWTLLFHLSYIKRMLETYHKKNYFNMIDAIPFAIPLAMYIFSGASLFKVIGMWILIVLLGSFIFSVIGFNAAHHHPDIFHEGDTPRANVDIDWGIHQLDSVADRYEITGNTFLVLTNFGDHALHHIFPTLDHATLQYLYPTFENTMKQFGLNLQMKSQIDMIVGQFKQLRRDKPNMVPPGSKVTNTKGL